MRLRRIRCRLVCHLALAPLLSRTAYPERSMYSPSRHWAWVTFDVENIRRAEIGNTRRSAGVWASRSGRRTSGRIDLRWIASEIALDRRHRLRGVWFFEKELAILVIVGEQLRIAPQSIVVSSCRRASGTLKDCSRARRNISSCTRRSGAASSALVICRRSATAISACWRKIAFSSRMFASAKRCPAAVSNTSPASTSAKPRILAPWASASKSSASIWRSRASS